MVRDEIQIAAEREYAVEEALAEGLAKGHAEGLAKGEAKGRAAGRAEANLETARKLKLAGTDIHVISQCTGLSIEKVMAL